MLLLVNSTKLMNLEATLPPRLRSTEPAHLDDARRLAADLRGRDAGELARLMDLSGDLARRTRADWAAWGQPDRSSRPAALAFTGLVFKHLDAATLSTAARGRARKRLRILSGLYGVLRPYDAVEAYRLEMGCRYAPPGARNPVDYWRDRVTDALNAELRDGEPVVSVASMEYLKAVDASRLRGPIIHPVFKERAPDGRLKTRVVHAKMARGALLRYALEAAPRSLRDLGGFGAMGWEAAEEPPKAGDWLFTRSPRD